MKQAFALLLLSLPGFAAQKTLTGQITDSMCGADHSAMANGGKKADPHDCTLVCVKGGAKFAFVSNGKVFDISNQNFADLTKHAGHAVTVTGDLGSDGKTITVSKLEMKK
jgi:hypothetical protein